MGNLKNKNNKLLFLIFILFSIILSSSIIFTEEIFFKQNTQKVALQNAQNKTKEREQFFKSFLEKSKDTISLIRESRYFYDFLANDEKQNKLEEILLIYSNMNSDIKNIYVLDKDGLQTLLISRAKHDDKASVLNEYKDYSSSFIFKNSKNKKFENVWFSKIENLTMSAIIPIIKERGYEGALVIEYFMDNFIKRFTNAPLYDMILCDENGNVIYHYNKKYNNIKEEFPNDYFKILNSNFEKTDKYVSRKFSTSVHGELFLILQLKKEYLQKQIEQAQTKYISILIVVFILTLFLTFTVIKLFSRTLLNLDKIKSLNRSLRKNEKLVINKNEEQRKLLTLFDKGDMVLFRWNNDAVYSVDYVSNNVINLFGYSKEEFLNSKILYDDCIYEEDRKRTDEEIKTALEYKSGYFKHKPYRIVSRDGKIKWVLDYSIVIRDENENVIQFLGYIVDITSQINIQNKFEEEKDKYQKMMNLSSDMIFILDYKGNLLEYSDESRKKLGYTKEEMKNLTLFDWDKTITKERNKEIRDLLSDVPLNFETIHTKKDGSTYIAQIAAVKIEISGESYVYASARDISETKEKEKQLLNAQFVSKMGHYSLDMNTNRFTTSPVVDKIFGIDDNYEKTIGNWLELIHDEDKNEVFNSFNKSIENRKNFEKEYRIVDFTTNEIKWVHALGIIILNDKTNEIDKIFGTVQDITERKEYQKNMQLALTVFDNTHDGIMITDSKNRIVSINPAFTKTTGYTLEEVKGENPKILKSNIQNEEFYNKLWKSLNKKDYWVGEIINKRKDGKLIEEHLTIIVIKNGSFIQNYIAIFSDISKQKQQERMLLQQARTSAVGEMIGNIAHQWRQPLSIISTASTGLKFNLEIGEKVSEEEISKTLDSINEHTQHLSKTIDDFRNFFRGDMSDIIEFDLNDAIEKVEELTKDSFINAFVDVYKDLDKDVFIEGNKNLLIQSLINIYNNALDALKEQELSKQRLFFISLKKEKNRSVIKIQDSAGGIAKENLDKIFEPYFTTKHESVGTGLGLYMTHQIITKQLKGKISVRNEKFEFNNREFEGALFTIEFQNLTNN